MKAENALPSYLTTETNPTHKKMAQVDTDGRELAVGKWRLVCKGTVIDGPALSSGWPSCPSQRVWVCDGPVTGVGDRQSAINTLECEALCRQRGVVRLDGVNGAEQLLSRLGRRQQSVRIEKRDAILLLWLSKRLFPFLGFLANRVLHVFPTAAT